MHALRGVDTTDPSLVHCVLRSSLPSVIIPKVYGVGVFSFLHYPIFAMSSSPNVALLVTALQHMRITTVSIFLFRPSQLWEETKLHFAVSRWYVNKRSRESNMLTGYQFLALSSWYASLSDWRQLSLKQCWTGLRLLPDIQSGTQSNMEFALVNSEDLVSSDSIPAVRGHNDSSLACVQSTVSVFQFLTNSRRIDQFKPLATNQDCLWAYKSTGCKIFCGRQKQIHQIH